MYDEQKSVDVISPSSILLSHLSEDLKRKIGNGGRVVDDSTSWDDIIEQGVYSVAELSNLSTTSVYTYGTLIVLKDLVLTNKGIVQIYISDNQPTDILIRTRWELTNPWKAWTKVQTTLL